MLNIQVCQEQFKDISKRYDSNYALLIEEINPILFWIKTVELPSLSLDTQQVPYEGVAVQNAGNTINFEHSISPTFFVDEKLLVHKYFHDWIIGWRNGPDYIGKKEKQGAIVLFDNNSTTIMGLYHFTNMYCDSMGRVSLRNKATAASELNVSIKFDEWRLEVNNQST